MSVCQQIEACLKRMRPSVVYLAPQTEDQGIIIQAESFRVAGSFWNQADQMEGSYRIATTVYLNVNKLKFRPLEEKQKSLGISFPSILCNKSISLIYMTKHDITKPWKVSLEVRRCHPIQGTSNHSSRNMTGDLQTNNKTFT